MTTMVEPVAICFAARLDDLDGQQRPVAADGVEYADHAIPLEVGDAGLSAFSHAEAAVAYARRPIP